MITLTELEPQLYHDIMSTEELIVVLPKILEKTSCVPKEKLCGLSTCLLAYQPKSHQPWFNSPDTLAFLPFNNKGSISGCGLFCQRG